MLQRDAFFINIRECVLSLLFSRSDLVLRCPQSLDQFHTPRLEIIYQFAYGELVTVRKRKAVFPLGWCLRRLCCLLLRLLDGCDVELHADQQRVDV